MIDIAMIGSVYEDLKVSKDIIRGISSLEFDTATQEKTGSAVQKIGNAQDMLLAIRDTISELQETNRNLRRELVGAQHWKTSLDQYALVKSIGGAMVYKFKAEPLHYACPGCIGDKNVQILQDIQDGYGTYVCCHCQSHYAVGLATTVSLQYGSCYSL